MRFPKLLLAFCSAFPVFAAPHGAKVISGKATLSPEAARLLVESTDKTILEWNGFSIDSHEQVHFHQFDRHSSVLNRVVGGSESSLLGTLTSNGKVYLINPNGVLIGPNARIETASFIASSLDILDADFLKDAFQFSGNELGSVVNLGTISCPFGTVALLSRKVKNEGTIEAAEGNVLLAAGSEVLLQLAHELQVFIRSRSLQFDESLNPYTEAIGASCEMSGLIDVSGAKGGTVYLFGEDVRLLNRTHIEASGTFGGGNVFIGGNREEKSAHYLWAGNESLIYADALEKGDGGRVILWAEKGAFHYGRISIRGGKQGGNGGFAEVSGSALQAQGFVDGLAPLGKAGKLLLDPTDVFINASATSGTFSSCVPPVTYNISAANPNNILNTSLQTQLASCNVTISTVGSSGTGTGSITVSSALTWSANTTLTLQAASFISISAAITNTSATPGFTAMAFTANGVGASSNGISLTAGLTTNTGNVIVFGNSPLATGVTISGSGNITTTSGNISVAGVTTSSSSIAVNLTSVSPLVSSTGAINVSGTAATSSTTGVNISSAWTTGTTGTVTFGAAIADPSNPANVISGCRSSTGTGLLLSGLVTQGSVIATNQIQGGSAGFVGSVQSSAGGDIKITGESTGLTTGSPNGISLSGTTGTTGTGNITLIGIVSTGIATASPTGGLSISGATLSHTGTGTINLAGLIRSQSAFSFGNTHGAATRIFSGTISVPQGAAVNISGDASAAFPLGVMDGVVILGAVTLSGAQSNILTFGAPISDGTVTVEGCQGSSGPGSSGFSIAGVSTATGSLTTSGSVRATNKILGGTGPGCYGFSLLAQSTTFVPFLSAGGDIQITASTQSIGTVPAHGIHLSGNRSISSTGTGTLTLIGTASPNSPGNGVNMAGGLVVSGAGSLNVAGSVPTNLTGTGIGVCVRTSNGIRGTGNIQINVSGTSGASGPGSHGVAIFSNWTLATAGLVTFGAPISDGSVTVSGCQGGSGTASHGLYLGGSFSASTLSSVVATNNILSGTGRSSFGLSMVGPFSCSAGGNITLAATSVGSGSGNYGIYIGSTLSTSGAGVINLTGVGSSNGSGSSNYGIYLDPNGASPQIAISSSSAMGYGVILTGTPGAGTTLGCSLSSNSVSPISLSGTASTFIQSTSGSIGLGGFFAFGSGTSQIASPCVLLSDFGFSSGPLVFDATIDGAFIFSAGSGNSLSLGGAIGGTTPLTNVTIGRNLLLTADVPITTLSSISLSGSMNGPHALSLTTGGNGTVNISNPTGTSSLASLAVSTDLITLNGLDLTTTGAVSFDSQTVLGTSSISISAGSDISFMSEISGNQPVDLTSSGAVFVGGVIDLSGGTTGGDFTVDADLDATFSDLINVSGTTDGGDVSISSTDGSVIVNDILTSGTSNAGGGITLQPSSALSSGSTGQIPVGTLQLNGTFLSTLGAISDGSLFLSPAGKSPEPSVATLFGNSLTENSVTFSCGAFEMGTNEALTIFGDATVYASASATFSDTIALGRISADSAAISLNTRAAIELLAANGTFYTSPSAHMLSSALPGFATAVSPAGSHTGVSGAVKASLIYVPDDLILNFDVNSPPPPPPTPSGPSVQPTPASFIYLLSVANAEFFDLLPLIGRDWQMPYRATFCEQKDLVCQRSVFFHFLTFLLENRLKE